MAIPSRQIGWDQKSNLLWTIAKQFEYITRIAGNIHIPSPIEPTTTTTTTTSIPNESLVTLNGDNLVTLSGDQIITL
jgi:hypothetical protein